MKFGAIYSDITGKTEVFQKRQEKREETEKQFPNRQSVTINEVSPAQSEMSAQMAFDWLSHPVTQQLIQDIIAQIDKLESTARSYAMSQATVRNDFDGEKAAIQMLVQAATLRQVVSTIKSINRPTNTPKS